MSKVVYMIAGEESGDVLGGRLMAALRAQGDYDFYGIGGTMMQEQGLDNLFPMKDLSLMGLFEILPKLPKLIQRIKQTVDDIIAKQPDIVVTIDAPDFCKRVVKRARKQCPNTKFIHYVAPTVWAWREGRAKTMAELFDGLICLFPFEPPYFEQYGLKAEFCGHPAIETIGVHNEKRENDHVLIFPGSRAREIRTISPIFADVYRKMRQMNPDLQAHIVAVPHLKDEIDEEFLGMDVVYIDPADRFNAMVHAPFALAKSGTTGLELAIAECPHVIAYKMNTLTWHVLKRLVTVNYAHIVNIMEGREVIPECVQEKCNVDDILQAVIKYDGPDLSAIRGKLAGVNPSKSPSEQAADFVTRFI